MANVTIETQDGLKADFMHHCGLTLPFTFTKYTPHGADHTRHVREIQNMDIRDDDLYLATYPKCGTHWTWEIMLMLQKGKPEYEKQTKVQLFLDLKLASFIDSKPSPRLLNSHFPCKLSPRGLFEKKIKIVNVMRNPKDAFVSLYYHMKTACKDEEFVKDFKTFLPFALGEYGLAIWVPFYEYMRQWEQFTETNPEQILNLFYEDMKEDPVREIKKIDKFLGTNRDDELIKKIAEACDFRNLKQADADVKIKEAEMPPGPSFIYRKGDVGDWKNHFTVSMNEQMDRWIEEKSQGCKLQFRYTI